MITKREPNPLNFFGARQTEMLPPNFHVLTMVATYNTQDSIVRWIYDHCKGRFYVGKGLELKDGTLDTVIKIGFEDPKESSYFVLACPYLKYH